MDCTPRVKSCPPTTLPTPLNAMAAALSKLALSSLTPRRSASNVGRKLKRAKKMQEKMTNNPPSTQGPGSNGFPYIAKYRVMIHSKTLRR